MGDKQQFDGDFLGNVETEIVAPGCTKSYAFDHSQSSDAAIARVDFNSTELYVHRLKYDEFTHDNWLQSTYVTTDNGQQLPRQGEFLASQERDDVSGLISKVDGNKIYFDKHSNTTVNDTPPVDFVDGERVRTQSFTGTIDSDWGVRRTFNYKTLRLWDHDTKNNMYASFDGYTHDSYAIVSEGESAQYIDAMKHLPYQWVNEEFIYRASDIDVKNGRLDYIHNGRKFEQEPFVTRTTERPELINSVYQSQVSNGCEAGTRSIYQSIYIDNSYCRVMVDNRPLPIVSWDCDEVVVETLGIDLTNKVITVFNRHNKIAGVGKF
jgi:hypothetical protein